MNYYRNEIKLNAAEWLLIECRRYRRANKWSVVAFNPLTREISTHEGNAFWAARCTREEARAIAKAAIEALYVSDADQHAAYERKAARH